MPKTRSITPKYILYPSIITIFSASKTFPSRLSQLACSARPQAAPAKAGLFKPLHAVSFQTLHITHLSGDFKGGRSYAAHAAIEFFNAALKLAFTHKREVCPHLLPASRNSIFLCKHFHSAHNFINFFAIIWVSCPRSR